MLNMMTDIYSSEKRSEIMSKVRGSDTKPEIYVRRFLFARGFRYRKNDKRFPGKPDIVLPKYRTIIFVHGCFWHGHKKCKAAALPSTNRKYWQEKIDKNRNRDNRNRLDLNRDGWKVYVVWECEIRNKKETETRLFHLLRQIEK